MVLRPWIVGMEKVLKLGNGLPDSFRDNCIYVHQVTAAGAQNPFESRPEELVHWGSRPNRQCIDPAKKQHDPHASGLQGSFGLQFVTEKETLPHQTYPNIHHLPTYIYIDYNDYIVCLYFSYHPNAPISI